MIQSRLFFWMGCFIALLVMLSEGMFATPVRGEELLQRDGRFIHLTTDLQTAEEAERLVASFDAAVLQWMEYWKLPESALANWTVDACVIRDKAEFTRRGLIPDHIPDFPFGYAWNDNVWVLAQQSEYYTRHLLMHEGVHSLAYHVYSGAGPTWFQEGTAELLATHQGHGPTTKINRIPANREDVPYWGRFKLIKQLRDDRQVPTLETVMQYQPDLTGNVATYGWSWAACMILDAYPEYRPALLAAAAKGNETGPAFNRDLARELGNEWPILAARWRLMCHDLDYGFDWARERVAISARDRIWDGRDHTFQVQADQGWQSCGFRIPKGAKVRVVAKGRITLADEPKPWVSEANGITFQYHQGRPLGQLLACVLPNASNPQATLVSAPDVHFADPDRSLSVPQYSWLLFRVNDAVGDLANNRGHFEVTLQRAR
ncbi:MAG: hypothetical protein ACR2NZ_22705 [Rubripirellula sp.]